MEDKNVHPLNPKISFSGKTPETSLETVFDFSNRGITDSDLQFSFLQTMTSYNTLNMHCNFSNNNITAASMPEIDGVNIKNGVLLYLALEQSYHVNLDNNKICDYGAFKLAATLLNQCRYEGITTFKFRCASQSNLASISLAGTGITDVGAKQIIMALKENKNMIYCNLSNNGISESLLKEVDEVLSLNKKEAEQLLGELGSINIIQILGVSTTLKLYKTTKKAVSNMKFFGPLWRNVSEPLSDSEAFDFCRNFNQRLNPILQELREMAYAKTSISFNAFIHSSLEKIYTLQVVMDQALCKMQESHEVASFTAGDNSWSYYVMNLNCKVEKVIKEI